MPTYDFTKGAAAISGLDSDKHFVAHIPVVVADIIADNALLTTNGKITAADIIRIWDIPAKTVILPGCILETVIAGESGNTGDIGVAGGDEMFNGVALDAAVGTLQPNLVGDDWGVNSINCVTFATTDTLDFKFVADEIAGSYILHVAGFKLF